jgi:hypothetical protein
MKMSRSAKMTMSIRQEVKKFGRKKTRARCKFFLHSLKIDPVNDSFAKDYRKACELVMGGVW